MTHPAPQSAPAPAPTSSWAMLRTLGGIALISGCLLSLVYQATQERIQRNTEARISRAVFDLLPGAQTQQVFEFAPDDGGVEAPRKVYAGYDAAGELVGVALEAADGGGYGGDIRLLYGYLPESNTLSGITVLLCKETPGLGDKIKTDAVFLANFQNMDVSLDDENKALLHPITYVKPGAGGGPGQVEGISGATISSTAVARAMRESTDNMLPLVWRRLSELKESTP